MVQVKVKPSSKHGSYVQLGIDGSLMVCVKEPALEGKANKAVAIELAKFYNVSVSDVSLKRGRKSKDKVFEIKNATD